ncbi:MAG: hypothetical protein IMZ52_03090 [Actinobacteria bacterium]|nr:hypothetical protein [Actinomycetota bacterium]MBE3120794.1 hypothetical protein [Thermoplasmata archaeon]
MNGNDEKITISDWIQYLNKIPESTKADLIGLATVFIAVLAIYSGISVANSVSLEGNYALNYRIDKINLNESRITFNLAHGPVLNLVDILLLIIILIMAIYVMLPFLGHTKLKIVVASKLAESILSSKYPELKNVYNIEEIWIILQEKITETKFLERRKLVNKSNKKQFEQWFNNIIRTSNLFVNTRLISDLVDESQQYDYFN